VGFACALGLLSGQSAWRRASAILLGALALAAPFLAPDAPVLRAAVALYLLWTCAKMVELGRDPVSRPAGFRVVHALVLHDLRRDGSIEQGRQPVLRAGLLGGALASGALAWVALHLALFESEALAPAWAWLLRHAAGVAFTYFGVEGALRCFELIYRGAGLRPPVMHAHPILSQSLREFWGRRWNRVVGNWLFGTFFRPFAARGRPRLGMAATFAASAALHLYFTWAAVGLRWGLLMAVFFLLQIPLLLLEARWGEARWRPPLRRIWTLGWLALTSPLFVAPMLAIIRGGLD
jgi:membrane bound O-acyltransferase family protein